MFAMLLCLLPAMGDDNAKYLEKPVRLGRLQIDVTNIYVAKIKQVTNLGRSDEFPAHLIIEFSIMNLSKDKRYQYKPLWTQDRKNYTPPFATDERQNKQEINMRFCGRRTAVYIDPGKTISDRVAFAAPLEDAKIITIPLPGVYFEQPGTARFRFGANKAKRLAEAVSLEPIFDVTTTTDDGKPKTKQFQMPTEAERKKQARSTKP